MDRGAIEDAVRRIIIALGEDPGREGLAETPRRVADMLEEVLEGYGEDVDYALFSESSDMVTIAGIRFTSLCEHHLMPIIGLVHIAYIPHGRVLGLSKFARIVNKYSRRLQIQERLTRQIAQEVSEASGSGDVAVIVEGYHMCTIVRGVRNPAPLITSTYLGEFRKNRHLREEFLENIRPFRLGKFPI